MAGTSWRATWNSGRTWLIFVMVLSLPALLFVSLYLLYASGFVPAFLGLPIAVAVWLTGVFGGVTTMAAFVVTVAATFQRSVSVNVKVILWSFVALSVAACWYGSYIPP
jgi:hypothetical protein